MRVFEAVTDHGGVIDVFEDKSDTDAVTFFDDMHHTTAKLSVLHSSLRDWGGVCGASSNIVANVGVSPVNRIHAPPIEFYSLYLSARRACLSVPYFSVGDSVVISPYVSWGVPRPGVGVIESVGRNNNYYARFDGISFLFDELDLEPIVAKAAIKCECGAAKCGSRIHSSWCPMA